MGLVKHGYGVGQSPDAQVVVSTAITVYDEQGIEIGFIQSLQRNDTRTTVPIRHLNKADAGRIVEQVPNVENYTLSASSFGLWNVSSTSRRSLLNRLPGSGSEAFVVLNQQQIPFVIRQVEEHPATGIQNVTLWLGCMLTSFNRPVNVGTATISETCNITPSWVEGGSGSMS